MLPVRLKNPILSHCGINHSAIEEEPINVPGCLNVIDTFRRRTKLLNMIVGFEIEVTDIQAKFKLSQNRPPEDQQSVVEKLSSSSNQTEAAVAKLMSGVLRAEC